MNENSKPENILILGAGTWQVPYLVKARDLGFKVFATDWSANAAGAKYAHVFEPIDLKDKEQTLRFAIKNKIKAILTAADVGIPTAAFVAEKLGLPYASQKLALEATNKYLMRKKAVQIGLPVPFFEQAANINEAKKIVEKLRLPAVIKPVDNCSSRGVYVINSIAELENEFSKSIAASNAGSVIIEELMTGTEGSVEAIIRQGKIYYLGICDKEKSPLPYRYDLQLNYPGNYTEKQYRLLYDYIEKLVAGFEIKSGIIHVEIMVEPERVRMIEFSIRGCGSNVITHLVPAMKGFDPVKYLINLAAGIDSEIVFTKNLPGILKFIMLPVGKIQSISGADKNLNIKNVVDFALEKKAGDTVEIVKDGRSRPGYILAVGKSGEDIADTINHALSNLHIEYENGRKIKIES